MFSFWGFWSANLRFEIRALRMLRVFWLVHIRIFKGVFCITCFDKTFEKLKNKVLFYGVMLLLLNCEFKGLKRKRNYAYALKKYMGKHFK